jgi:hypothetical protein
MKGRGPLREGLGLSLSTVVTATPADTLGSQKRYRLVLNANIKSATGKDLEQPFSFRFTTRR